MAVRKPIVANEGSDNGDLQNYPRQNSPSTRRGHLRWLRLGNSCGFRHFRTLSVSDQRRQSAGPWAPIVFVAVKTITYVIAPLSGGPLQIMSGTLFGLWEGTALTLLGDTLGGCINFWISRLVRRVERAIHQFFRKMNPLNLFRAGLLSM